MSTEQKAYKIGALAKMLHVEKFVIRFWEKEFNIAPGRSDGGQRSYTKEEVDLFKNIKHLLYEKKFTVAGARAELQKSDGVSEIETSCDLPKETPAQYTLSMRCDQNETVLVDDFTCSLIEFREQLVKLRNLL